MNKDLRNMSFEEIMKGLAELNANFEVREGDNKAVLKNKSQSDKERIITVEKDDYTLTIETSIHDEVEIDVYEETDEAFGRRVRFHLKVESFRKQQALRQEKEAKQPEFIKKAKAFKDNFNKVSCELLDALYERLSN